MTCKIREYQNAQLTMRMPQKEMPAKKKEVDKDAPEQRVKVKTTCLYM